MLVPNKKHTHGPPRPVTGIALFSYVDYVSTSQETHYGPPRPVNGERTVYLKQHQAGCASEYLENTEKYQTAQIGVIMSPVK
jgi:hypothetical protein